MSRAAAFVPLLLLPVVFAGTTRGEMVEFLYSGTFEYVFYESNLPLEPITPGTPWTARVLFDDTVENYYPPDIYGTSVAVYSGIRADLTTGDSLFHFALVTIGVTDNCDQSLCIDSIDVFAGPSAELYLSLYDETLTAIHSTALPTTINLADWPNHGIAFNHNGANALGSINHIASRIVPEPAMICARRTRTSGVADGEQEVGKVQRLTHHVSARHIHTHC